jgi:YVTN family beta-propeller protein
VLKASARQRAKRRKAKRAALSVLTARLAKPALRAAAGVACAALCAACGGKRDTGPREVAADGLRHYTTYSAAGEVTDDAGAVDIYAATHANALSLTAARARPLVYVPNSRSASVSVIDPRTYRVVRTFETGQVPQHVVPSYDLTRLWVLNNASSSLTPIDPVTGNPGAPIHVDDPYNMYFTPNGQFAVVVAERRERLDFLDPGSMRLVESIRTSCRGIDHMEFTADGRYVIATCEFNGRLMKLDLADRKIVGYVSLASAGNDTASMPQDIRSSADGRRFFVADMKADGVHVIDPVAFQRVGFIHTGKGAHGLYPSRDGRLLYVTNRGWNTLRAGPHGPGSISVIDPVSMKVIANWPIPGGGSPDMGNVTADGKELWVSGRYDAEVYVFDTATGELTHRIPVGREPHGLCVWPQPGRYSTGHTGNMR